MDRNRLKTMLLTALVLVATTDMKAAHTATTEESGDSAIINTILTRSSVRNYQQRPVEDEKIRLLLRAGMAAPTAVNRQPWHFVVVNDRQQLDALAEANPNARMLRSAPLAIVVCGDMKKALEGTGREFWIQDASAATENILLAAHGLGLGAVWTGTYPGQDRMAAVTRVLHLPEHIVPLNTIVIGYPEGEQMVRQKFKKENISYNFFGQQTGDLFADNATKEDKKADKKEWKEFKVSKDFNCNPFMYYRGDGLLLCAGTKKKSNAMTIGWGGLGTLWGRNVVTVYVAEKRYTHDFMEESPYFTVMSFSNPEVLRYMGTKSGRDGDKAKALGLHTRYTENGTPYYEEADEVIECRLICADQLNEDTFRDYLPRNFYAHFPAGYHSMYIGEVVKAMRK